MYDICYDFNMKYFHMLMFECLVSHSGAILGGCGNFKRWALIRESWLLGMCLLEYHVSDPLLYVSTSCLLGGEKLFYHVFLPPWCPAQTYGATWLWTEWNHDPQSILPSLSCSCQVFDYCDEKLTDIITYIF
jgi:hypothetical protein